MTDLPAYLQNLPSRNLAQTAIANVGAGNPPYMSIAGGRFTLIDVAGNTILIPTLHVDVIVVDINNHVSKIFFGLNKPWDPDNPIPPVCFSDNGIGPSSTVAARPECGPTCAVCPQNVWGSKISQMGSQVKQCADQQKIAIYIPDQSENLFLLRIPPGSFSNWRAYMVKFAGSNLDPDRVVTRITFEPPPAVGTLVFQAVGYIGEQQCQTVSKMIVSRVADAMIGKLDKPRETGLVAPPAAPMLPISAPTSISASPAASILPAQPAAPVPPVTAAPARRKRRTQAEIAAAQPAPQPTMQPVQAPFRLEQPPAPQVPPTQPQGQFGMVQNAPAPPPELDLDAIFKS